MKKNISAFGVFSTLIFVGVMGFLIMKLIAWPYYIAGDCMEPVVKDGSYAFVNRVAPYVREHKIGDIIVFTYEEKPWIARVVALENDTIHIANGIIKVNGVPLQDLVQRNWTDWEYGSYAINELYQVPANHVYVLSDNLAAHHDDSRVFGPISKKIIFGAVW